MPTNVMCFGDSITHAASFAEADRWPVILQRLLDDRQPGAWKVYNRGIGGNTTCQGSDRFNDAVIPWLPAILLIEFGFNDCNVRDWTTQSRVHIDQFKRKLDEFITIARQHDSRPVLIVNHTIGERGIVQPNGQTYKQTFLPYNEAIRELAKTTDTPAIDLPAMMAERQIDLDDFLAEDQLHLTPQGNHDYAAMLVSGLESLGYLA